MAKKQKPKQQKKYWKVALLTWQPTPENEIRSQQPVRPDSLVQTERLEQFQATMNCRLPQITAYGQPQPKRKSTAKLTQAPNGEAKPAEVARFPFVGKVLTALKKLWPTKSEPLATEADSRKDQLNQQLAEHRQTLPDDDWLDYYYVIGFVTGFSTEYESNEQKIMAAVQFDAAERYLLPDWFYDDVEGDREPISTSPALLILSCSQRKRGDSTSGKQPAIELYDGPLFRVLRKAKREQYCPDNLRVLILSAKFGLIKAHDLIPHYDQRMTAARALELLPDVTTALQQDLALPTDKVLISLGQSYLPALPTELLPPSTQYLSGGIGQRSAQLKAWLKTNSS